MGANLGSTKANVFFSCSLSKLKMGANLGSSMAGVLFSCSLSKLVHILALLKLVYFFPALCQNGVSVGISVSKKMLKYC